MCRWLLRFAWALLLLPTLIAASDAPWRTDVAAARAEALKAGRPCVLFVNINASALCGLLKDVEVSLLSSKEIAGLRQKAVLAAARIKDAEAAELRKEFDLPLLCIWIVVLDGKGETLASYMSDATGLGCSDSSIGPFPAKIAELAERGLEIKPSLQSLERHWRAHPGDAEALDALAQRYWDCYRPRAFAELCDRELANEKLGKQERNLLRLYRFLSQSHGWYALGNLGNPGRKAVLREEGEGLLFDLPGHAKAGMVEDALLNSYAMSITFDVPGKIGAIIGRLRTRAKDSPEAEAVERRAKSFEERLARWKRDAEAARAAPDHEVFLDVRLGDAKATLETFGGDENKSAYYKDILDEARAKLANQGK